MLFYSLEFMYISVILEFRDHRYNDIFLKIVWIYLNFKYLVCSYFKFKICILNQIYENKWLQFVIKFTFDRLLPNLQFKEVNVN